MILFVCVFHHFLLFLFVIYPFYLLFILSVSIDIVINIIYIRQLCDFNFLFYQLNFSF